MGGGFGFNDFTFDRAEKIFEEFFKNEGGFGMEGEGFDDDFFNNGFFGNNKQKKNRQNNGGGVVDIHRDDDFFGGGFGFGGNIFN